MSAIIRPLRWFDMVTPSREEMDRFLREYIGPEHWRVPHMRWHELFLRNAGILIAENRIPKLRRFQRGSVSVHVQANAAQQGVSGDIPDLSNVVDEESNVAPTASRMNLWYDSDGEIRFYAGTALNPTYAQLTTQSDDANDHTLEWWPDNPETNEGLNWDIRYTNLVETGTSTSEQYFSNASVDRIEDTWYLLDTVSNDAGDGVNDGCIRLNRNNGVAKTPSTGTFNVDVDIEIRVTGSGSAVASHNLDLTVTGT